MTRVGFDFTSIESWLDFYWDGNKSKMEASVKLGTEDMANLLTYLKSELGEIMPNENIDSYINALKNLTF